MSEYYEKYLKYKNKYVDLKNELNGGMSQTERDWFNLDLINQTKQQYVSGIMRKCEDYAIKYRYFLENKCKYNILGLTCYKTWKDYVQNLIKTQKYVNYKHLENFSEEDYKKINNKIKEIDKVDEYNKWAFHHLGIYNVDIINSLYNALITLDLKDPQIIESQTHAIAEVAKLEELKKNPPSTK
jgi:hypothetical protein